LKCFLEIEISQTKPIEQTDKSKMTMRTEKNMKMETVKTESNIKLQVIPKNTCSELECAICYAPIKKVFFKCSAPCNKVFHTNCLEQAMEQTQETAFDHDEEPEHKCCYCRRQIDVDDYLLQIYARHLETLNASGCYDVREAIEQVDAQMENGQVDEDVEYVIYELRDTSFQKKPKQAKNQKNQNKHQSQQKTPRMRIKQNIGGRRR
jgi:hypothetical protein